MRVFEVTIRKRELKELDSEHLSFRLSEDFVASYKNRKTEFGFECGGNNTLGEVTWLTKYSNLKPDGTKEKWYEGCERIINGMFSILKNHCAQNKTPWNHMRAQRSAEEAYERLFTFKWTPPGRGLEKMGTRFVFDFGSACLNNCAVLSTSNIGPRNPTLPFMRLFEMSMLGIGVGFDVWGAGKITLHEPTGEIETFIIPDSREGWCESLDLQLRSYFLANRNPVVFDYSLIRAAGEPLKTFGGTASGPGPLIRLHKQLDEQLRGRAGQVITETDIVDIFNKVAKCAVAGGTRRSATLALGHAEDKEFLDLKNPDVNPERVGADGWGYLSNNSVLAQVGGNYDHLIDRIAINGEPGLIYLDVAREYGRLIDPPNNKDNRIVNFNPCVEMGLEPNELCTLVDVYPTKHESLEDFKRTLKYAYLYGKAVTLLPTHWPESNEVMQRNRRIGLSMSGIAQFIESKGWAELRTWQDNGYAEIKKRDVQYSEWLGIRESIKMTTVKPSGTTSLVTGVTPGVHWPENVFYIRRMRFRANDPLVPVFERAGYKVEPAFEDPTYTVVVEFPTRGPQVRTVNEVSLWEKVSLAASAQKWWSDNGVSATFSFKPEEKAEIGPVIQAFDGQLKALSFLPITETGAFKQMPYEAITEEEYERRTEGLTRLRVAELYKKGSKPESDRFCTTDVCLIEPQ